MPLVTLPIHQGIDPHNVIHRFCLLHNVQILLNGLVLNLSNAHPAQFTALLDTGASNTYIGQGIVELLNIEVLHEDNAAMGNGNALVSIYENTGIRLPNDLGDFNVQLRSSGVRYATELEMPYHIILGMDILSQGNFSINGLANEYTLEFVVQ